MPRPRTAVALSTGALVAAWLCVALGAAGAPAAAAADGDATVASLRRDADRAGATYFDALGRLASLDTEMRALEARLPNLAARRRSLQAAVESRAVAAYKVTGSVQLASIIASDDALQAARRTQWLDRLNARDNVSFRRLAKLTAQLRAQRAALRRAREEQRAALGQLDATSRGIEAKLQAAEDRANSLASAAAQTTETTLATPPRPVAAPTTAGQPPPAPIGYQPTPGTHPHHDDPFLVCTRARESGGNYQAYNPAGPYMGAYQFLQASWNSGANHAGRPELIGVPPHTASEYDQDDIAWTIYQWQGAGPWGGSCA